MHTRLSRFALSALMLAGITCGGGSSSQPGTPTAATPALPPATTISIVDPQRLLSEHNEAIVELIEQTLARARAPLGIDGVTITVDADPNRVIPGWGMGGFAPDGFTMDIAIDPSFPNLGGLLPERLPAIIAHELHHNARWRGPGYGSTLLESMVSEGLADHFAIELLESPIPPWSRAFAEDQTARFVDRARPELDSSSFNFDAWFFGTSGL